MRVSAPMRERALDQFESVFERASLPVLEIRELELRRLSAVLRGGVLDASVLKLAEYLRRRFAARVWLHWCGAPAGGAPAPAGFERADRPFGSTAGLVAQVAARRAQLLLLPEFPAARPALDLEALVRELAPPVLLIRRPIARPQSVFVRILHSLTGNFQQTENFAYSFTLVAEQGQILLLHAIDRGEVEQVRQTLRVARQIAPAEGQELLRSLAHHGERYLKAVVAASAAYPYQVSYRLEVGAVRALVERELGARDYGLLVVGRHRQGQSQVEAEDYQLMHAIDRVPVLAL